MTKSHFRGNLQKACNRGKYKQYRNECLTSDLHTPGRCPQTSQNPSPTIWEWIMFELCIFLGGIFQWHFVWQNPDLYMHTSTNTLKNEQLAVLIGKQLYFFGGSLKFASLQLDQHCFKKNLPRVSSKWAAATKPFMRFHYTDWLIGILILAYYNLHIIG